MVSPKMRKKKTTKKEEKKILIEIHRVGISTPLNRAPFQESINSLVHPDGHYRESIILRERIMRLVDVGISPLVEGGMRP